jgi:hypothetical protein
LDAKQFSALMDKMDKLLRLETLGAVKELTSEREKVELLDTVGFTATEIDRYLGKTLGYSASVLYQIRKKKQLKEPEPEGPVTTPAVTV